MSKYKAVAVKLPHLVPVVWLSPELAKTLNLIMNAGAFGIDFFTLVNSGIDDPHSDVIDLQKLGAAIHLDLCPAIDKSCELFWDEVSCFTYKGWMLICT